MATDPSSGAGPPMVSSGSLKTKISLKTGSSTNSALSHFYCMKPELPSRSQLLGSTNLLDAYELGSAYSRFCGSQRKMREDLESFLPHLYGNFNLNATSGSDFSSLKQLVEKPPITGKELVPLTSSALSGWRLNPGPVDEAYRHVFGPRRDLESSEWKEEEKHTKKHRDHDFKRSLESLYSSDEDGERKAKRHRGDDKEKKKKKKKEKKKKKDGEERKHRKDEPMEP